MDFHSKCNLGALSLAVLVVFSLTFAYGANDIITNTDGRNYKILNYGEPLKLICNVTNREPGLVMTWLKDDKPLLTSATERPNYVVKDDTVSIHRAMDDEVANYTCQLINPKNNNSVVKRAEIYVVGRPYVKLPETVTVVEEEKLKLECIVLGKPPPITVEWIIGNKSYMQSEGRVKLSSEKGMINNIMELEPAQMSDRGDFVCLADNIATTFVEANRATVYVRVKGKYAALWPFLGIVAEVIVLCAVIFIYEKKRNKAELEESDTDQSPEQKNTPDHGKESVRHRK